MIVALAALLLAASLSIGLRTTSGWLDHWHPMDRLLLAIVLGAIMLAASLMLSSRYGVIQAGYGLAFSLAPVGVYDGWKWWHRSRGARSAWLIGAEAAPWLLACRWMTVLGLCAAVLWLASR